ncbi:MAG: precorrin-8X methylmutase [ANME-2 cluster archaeon]|jgi:precorrin-8X/cobalt-precorrin-8 methylmutase|nr:precorrin-8X methylmutase [ANME-2 cluster archaeon]
MNTELVRMAGHHTKEIDPELVRRCIEPGATTPEAMTIAEAGRAVAREIVGDSGPEDKIRQRCVVATGDPAFKDLLVFSHDPIRAGLDAMSAGAPIYTDIRMVQTGIIKTGHDCQIQCALDAKGSDALAQELGITRTSAGFLTLEQDLQDSIIVIGNAPSAAITLSRMVEYGIRPAFIVAVPVGFVNAAESKERVRELDVPSITCTGTRGGTPVAVACINELIVLRKKQS